MRGDADESGDINISDATVLIDYLLNSSNDINIDNADCDLNGEITITDVTVLIDYLLSGT